MIPCSVNVKQKKEKKAMYTHKNKKRIFWLVVLFFCMFLAFTGKVLAQEEELANKDIRKADKMMEVNLYKKDQAYSVKSITIIGVGGYYLASYESMKGKVHDGVVMSFKGKALGYFQAAEMNIVMCWDNFSQRKGGCDELPEGNIRLLLPYFPNGKYADIYDPEGKKILTIDLSSKATCNENEICDKPVEDNINCSSDCKVQDEPSNQASSNQGGSSSSAKGGSGEQQTEAKTNKGNSIVLIVLTVIALLVIVGVAIVWIRKQREEDD